MTGVGASYRGGRLTIPDSQPHYSGRYVCTVYLVDGQRSSGYASLVVEEVRPRGSLFLRVRPSVCLLHSGIVSVGGWVRDGFTPSGHEEANRGSVPRPCSREGTRGTDRQADDLSIIVRSM